MMNDQNNQLRRLVLLWLLALGLVWAACSDDDEGPIAPPPDGDLVDLSAFAGCWHIHSDTTVFGSPGPCRTSLDSIAGILTVAGSESLFAAIDTVTHLGFVAPYYGNGDFTGTNVSGREGDIVAEYRRCRACHKSRASTAPDPGDTASGFLHRPDRIRRRYAVHRRRGCSAFVTFEAGAAGERTP
jgi:hypothetical protein